MKFLGLLSRAQPWCVMAREVEIRAPSEKSPSPERPLFGPLSLSEVMVGTQEV